MRDSNKFSLNLIRGALLLAALCGSLTAQAQLSAVGTATDFRTSEYFPPPNYKQMKFQLSGDEGKPLGGEKFLVKQPKLQTFSTNGDLVMVVEASECIYDREKFEAGSPGHLRVRTGDGKFLIEGDGFLWRDSEKTIVISNNVHSELRRPMPNSATSELKPPLVITSREFQFDIARRIGAFRDSVQGEDPEVKFSSGTLTVSASTNGPEAGRSFDRLVAEPNATILRKTNNSTASAQRMIYTRNTDTIELFGDAKWKEGVQEGRADYWVLRQREKSFAGEGHVAMRLPRETVGVGVFFGSPTNAPVKMAAGTTQLVDFSADRFQSRSNFSISVAEGSVRIVDGTNRLDCDKLTAQLSKTAPANDTAIAEGNVMVSSGNQNQHIRSQRAVYTRADERIVFTGDPEWKLESGEGRAPQLEIYKATGEIRATGGVAAKIAVSAQQGSVMTLLSERKTTHSAPGVIEFFGRELRAKDGVVTLTGDARAHQSPITGGESRLHSDVIEAQFGKNNRSLETIQARNNVVYEQGIVGVTNQHSPDTYRKMLTRKLTATTDAKSGKLSSLVAEGGVEIEQFQNRAKGARATYSGDSNVLKLTGNPTLEMPEGLTITETSELVWDEANKIFGYSAPFKSELRVKGLKSLVEKKPSP